MKCSGEHGFDSVLIFTMGLFQRDCETGLARPGSVRLERKLQAPVYDILPTTTAVFSYAIGSRKLSANAEQGAGVSRFLPADYFGIYSRIAVVLPQ